MSASATQGGHKKLRSKLQKIRMHIKDSVCQKNNSKTSINGTWQLRQSTISVHMMFCPRVSHLLGRGFGIIFLTYCSLLCSCVFFCIFVRSFLWFYLSTNNSKWDILMLCILLVQLLWDCQLMEAVWQHANLFWPNCGDDGHNYTVRRGCS